MWWRGASLRELAGFRVQLRHAAGPGLTFAIADFDGDQRLRSGLDYRLAVAPRATATTGSSFSALLPGRQFIRLVAPAGGLLIEARDVNGDHTVDLVFTSAWFRQPVAVLLNDGHGRFLRAEPGAFPGAFRESHTSVIPATSAPADVAGLPPQPDAGMQAAAEGLLYRRSPGAIGACLRRRFSG